MYSLVCLGFWEWGPSSLWDWLVLWWRRLAATGWWKMPRLVTPGIFLSGGIPLSSSEFLCQRDIPYFLIWEFWVAADIGISRYRLYAPGAGAGILGFGPWVSGYPRRWWAPGIPVWSAFPWPSIAWSCPCTSFGTKPGSSFLGPWEEPHCSVGLRGGTS